MWVKGEIFRNLDDARATARQALSRKRQRRLFDRLDWFERTWAHCPPGTRPLIVRARAEGSDCWLFLAESALGKAVALASWYTLAYRPVFTGKPDEATQRALLTASARRLAKPLASITLSPMPEDDAALVAAAFRRAGWIAFVREATVSWTVDVAGKSFADYWGERPGELRSTVKRKRGKGGVETRTFDRFDADAWAAYEDIYADSWKPEEGAPAFLRDMAEVEGAAGTLRLGLATIDDRPVAAQLWTVENGTAIIHKLAHRSDAGEFSPGSILTADMFARVIDVDRVATVDFGTGDDGYKADWMDRRAPLMRVSLFNPRRPAGLLDALAARLRGR